MIRVTLLILLGLACIQDVSSFHQSLPTMEILADSPLRMSSTNQQDTEASSSSDIGRKKFLSHLLAVPAVGLLSAPRQVLAEEQAEGKTVFKTPSGLKYLELQEGSGPTPRYGQLCAIQYTASLKLPTESTPQKFDSNSFLIKHGNGRIIAGLDEGIHTMKAGSKRRLIIPPKLGYTESGLGPLPELPWNRWTLNRLLNQMIEQRGGNLVFEVELVSMIDDEADQGYYEDASPTPEEFERLRLNFQEKTAAAAVMREAADNMES